MNARALRDIPSKTLIVMVRIYQATLSPWIGRQCRFVPTCSQYFIDAVETHGAWKGMCKGIWRILRCNPFCRGGYDPVTPSSGKGPNGN